jgi:hypothetical protein
MDAQPTSFWAAVWAKLKGWGEWAALKLLAPGVALVVVLGAVALVVFGFKGLQIGGILAKLLGKTGAGGTAIDVANSVPSTRIDANGKLIPEGVSDSKGDTQVVVVPIENTGGLFSNPDTIRFTPPGETTAREIQLPDGVKASDVEKVIVIQPEKFVVTVKDSSGITAQHIDDLLKKYGG